MTMAKIAEKAGVSVSAVSKAFSYSKDIGVAKREEIFQVAREMGCYDKYCKNKYERPVIAVIVPEFQSRLYSEQLTIWENEIRKHGGIMIAASAELSENHKSELVTFLAEYSKVDGIIMHGNVLDKQYSIPIISITTSEQQGERNVIQVSGGSAIVDAISYLAENGHSDIAFISEKNTQIKKETFENSMRKFGLSVCPEFVVESAERFEKAGYEGMNRLLSLEKIPTAVITAYDNIAIGAMKSISEHGLKIPEDISIIGTDDIREGSYLDVPLTTVTLYNEELCQIVTDMIFEQIQGGYASRTKRIKVNKELVKRGSVGKVKK